jgi:hypothetical protein
VLGLQSLAIDRHGVRAGECAAATDNLDAAPVHHFGERTRDAADHRFLAVDQRWPIDARLTASDVMRFRALDLVERMRRRDEHLIRHATSVGASAAKQIRLDHCDPDARLSRRNGDTHPGVAPAENDDIEVACWDGSIPSETRPTKNGTRP